MKIQGNLGTGVIGAQDHMYAIIAQTSNVTLVNVAIVALMLIFLTLPAVFLLSDRMRQNTRRDRYRIEQRTRTTTKSAVQPGPTPPQVGNQPSSVTVQNIIPGAGKESDNSQVTVNVNDKEPKPTALARPTHTASRLRFQGIKERLGFSAATKSVEPEPAQPAKIPTPAPEIPSKPTTTTGYTATGPHLSMGAKAAPSPTIKARDDAWNAELLDPERVKGVIHVIPTKHMFSQYPTLAQQGFRRTGLAVNRAIHIVPLEELKQSHLEGPSPLEVGYIASDTVINGPIEFHGELHVGPRCKLNGPLRVMAGLELESGVCIDGPVSVGGHLHVGVAAEIKGRVSVGASATLMSWSRVNEIEAVSEIRIHEGAVLQHPPRSAHVVFDPTDDEDYIAQQAKRPRPEMHGAPPRSEMVTETPVDTWKQSREPLN